MDRLFELSGVPVLVERHANEIVGQLEHVLSTSGVIPLAIVTVVAYFLFIGYHRTSRRSI